MVTLADLIFEPTRRATYRIIVGGVELRPSSQAAGLGQLAGVPGVVSFGYDHAQAHIVVNRAPSWMRAGMPVTIDAGFNGLMMRVWTGFVVAMPGEDPDYLRDKVIVRGATVQVGTPPDDVPVELNAVQTLVGADVQPPFPAGTHAEHEVAVPLVWDSTRLSQIAGELLNEFGVVPRRPAGEPNRQTILCGGELYKAQRPPQLEGIDLSGFTDEDAINLVCDLVGIEKRSLIEPDWGWYTFDVGAMVRRGRPLDMLTELMKVGMLEAYHTEDGTVIFRRVSFMPGPSHAWQYNVQNQDLARVISATGQLQVLWNPFVRQYSTGLINIPFLNFVSERVFARYVSHEWPENGNPVTNIDAQGGSRLGGAPSANPIAAFTFTVVRQVFADGFNLIYSCDASPSFDPDGDASLLTYAWANNRTTTPAHPFTTKQIAFRVPATVATPLTETLTVTDPGGLTHSVSIDLPTAVDAPEMRIPPIAVAAGTRTMVTPDGGGAWNDLAESTASAAAARLADGVNFGQYLFGFTDGRIERTLDSNLVSTQVLAAVGSAFNDVIWDWRDGLVAWGITETCKLYRSPDAGATWALYDDLRVKLGLAGALGNFIGLPGAGGVYIFGGGGDGIPLIAYVPVVGSHDWVRQTFTGHLLADTPGIAGLRIAALTAPGDGAATMILSGASGGGPSGLLVAVYHTTSDPGPTADYSRATGLTVGLSEGRVMMESAQGSTIFRIAMFNNRDVWRATAASPLAYTQIANVLDAGFSPNHGLFLSSTLGGLPGVREHLVAIEDAGGTGGVVKSIDEMATVGYLRPATGFPAWPAGAKAKKIAIGAPVGTLGSSDFGILIASAASPVFTARYLLPGAAHWASTTLPANIDGSLPLPICATRDNWFVCDVDGVPTGQAGQKASRSTDAGKTWSAAAIGDEQMTAPSDWFFGFAHIARSASGRLWGVRRKGTNDTNPIRLEIYFSDTNGATWTLSSVYTLAGNNRYPFRIACHPTNENIVAVWAFTQFGDSFFRVSTNASLGATATWVNNGSTPPIATGHVTQNDHFLILANGRFVIATGDNTSTKVYTSDDRGVTWTLRLTFSVADHWLILAGASGAKVVAYAAHVAGIVGDHANEKAYVSTDSATTWAAVGPVHPRTGTVDSTWAAKYDGPSDTLVVANSVPTNFRVVKFTPVSSAGVWTDLTLDLPAGGIWGDGMALIPRT